MSPLFYGIGSFLSSQGYLAFLACLRVDAVVFCEFTEWYDPGMPKFGIPTLGWLTSILLSLVTLFVFGSLQNYGPDSVVQQFHQAAAERNQAKVQELVDPDFDSAATQELWALTVGLMASGRTEYAITNHQRKANQEVIVVRYRFPNGELRTLLWGVDRKGGSWVIDTRQTTLAARYLLFSHP